MEKPSYIESGTYLFRFMDHGTAHFWLAVADLLSESKVFLNSRTEFNDPYDSQPIIEDDVSSFAIRDYFNNTLTHPFNPNRSLKGIARILDAKALGRTNLKKKDIQFVKDGLHKNASHILDGAGILSFSLTAENPLLWGHYAASFSGVCAVFRRGRSLDSALSLCARVSYVHKCPRLPLSLLYDLATLQMANLPRDKTANKLLSRAFLYKSNHWSYEREARIFYPFHAFKKLPFDRNELVAIILGPKSPDDLEHKMTVEIRERRPSLSLHRASLSQNDFRIILPHQLARNHADAA